MTRREASLLAARSNAVDWADSDTLRVRVGMPLWRYAGGPERPDNYIVSGMGPIVVRFKPDELLATS